MLDMEQIKGALTRKVGPLPAWAWGVVVAGGIWIWRGFRGQLTSPASTDSTPSTIGGTSVIPSLSGGGAVSPNYGAPGGEGASTYVSTPYFTAEGAAATVGDLFAAFLASGMSDPSVGGGAIVPTQSDPTGYPTTTIGGVPINPTQLSGWEEAYLSGSQLFQSAYDARVAYETAAGITDSANVGANRVVQRFGAEIRSHASPLNGQVVKQYDTLAQCQADIQNIANQYGTGAACVGIG